MKQESNRLLHLGLQHSRQGSAAEAMRCFREAVASDPSNAVAWGELGSLLSVESKLDLKDEATDCLRKSLSLEPSQVAFWMRLLKYLEAKNQIDEAQGVLEEIKRRFPGLPALVIFEGKLLRRAGKADDAIALMEGYAAVLKDKPPSPAIVDFFFELGRAYDAADRPDQAFASFHEAQLRYGMDPRTLPPRSVIEGLEKIYRNYAASGIRFPPAQITPSGTPVFLVGFPRSGTTLLDQILSGHPSLSVAEEKPAVHRMFEHLTRTHGDGAPSSKSPHSYVPLLNRAGPEDIRAMRQAYFEEHSKYLTIGDTLLIDKHPTSMYHVGLIQQVFPGAKFILAMRHPCDVVLSNFMQKFRRGGGDLLTDIAHTYATAFKLWDLYVDTLKPQVHLIRYEDLVSDFQPTVSSLLGFLGVEWNDNVLEFDKTAHSKRRIETPSYHQVVQKLYNSSSGRWLRYRRHLAPVIPILQPFIEKYGYSSE